MYKLLTHPLRISRYAFKRLGEERGTEAAASMAFYGFFSLFPLLLVLVVVGSSILKIPRAEAEVLEFLVSMFPFSGELVAKNIEQVLQARGSVGAVALVALTWSGTGAFSVLATNINRAWPETDQHAFLKRRLFALVMLFVLVVILLLLFVLQNVVPFLLSFVDGWDTLLGKLHYFSSLMIGGTLFVALLILYRWIPNRRVSLVSGVWGGLVASCALGVATKGFTWYLKSGLARYNLVYGSLGAIAVLLL
ncbi:MAG: YihY/virulence factor BrkB family protein, partial [Chloroflexota bacterium]|nr:YihY/virulence factor BrkB family protein [Chloroflexota bacterium]